MDVHGTDELRGSQELQAEEPAIWLDAASQYTQTTRLNVEGTLHNIDHQRAKAARRRARGAMQAG